MASVIYQPCDEGVIRGARASALCRPSSRPWVIAATSLGSGMVFLDSTVLNVALPALQEDLGAAEALEGMNAGTAARIKRAVDESVVAGFRAVMLVSAGFAFASALAAALLVGDRRVRSASRDSILRMDTGSELPVPHASLREEATREGTASQPVAANTA